MNSLNSDDRQQLLNDDEPTCEIVYEPVKQTAYDRRRAELREAVEKRDVIAALPERTQAEQKQLAVLEAQVAKAQERFDSEAKRGSDDLWRKRRGIDIWRGDEGRELYNASRRMIRSKPNEKLTDLTPEQKAQRQKDQRADGNFRKARAAKGWSEDQIASALAVRIEARLASRSPEPESSEMEQDPTYGMF